MSGKIILLSGPIGSGKTTLGSELVLKHGFSALKTRDLISARPGVASERMSLQEAGEKLDRKTKGRWVVDALARLIPAETSRIIIDAVRTVDQVEAVRLAFGNRVVHIHLTASEEVLADRYSRRSSKISERASFKEARANATESRVGSLANIADLVINTERSSSVDTLVRVASYLGLYGRSPERLVDVLVGGQYGSEGKGQIAAYLAPEYDLLVRVGGPNAGHKVFEEPTPYTFHQLPSGTRCSEAGVLLGPGAVLWLPQVLQEIADCGVSSERLSIDPQAMIIEPEDRLFEKEALEETIASTAQGVGSATSRKVLRSGAGPKVRLAKNMPELRPFIRETSEVLDEAFAAGKRVFLEGTQGSGLSLHHGSYPHVTSRDTTVSGCLAEAGIAPSRVRRILLVCRTYPIRVGNADGREAGSRILHANEKLSGPMKNELEWDDVASRSGIPLAELEETERTSTTKRRRRVGEFDWGLFRKSVSLNGPTDLVLTFADYLSIKNRAARRFEQLSEETLRFIEELERVAAAPVSLIATRFHSRSIIDRRLWKRE